MHNALNCPAPPPPIPYSSGQSCNFEAVWVSAAAVVFGGDPKMALLLLLAVSRAMAMMVTEVSSQRENKEALQYQQSEVVGVCEA